MTLLLMMVLLLPLPPAVKANPYSGKYLYSDNTQSAQAWIEKIREWEIEQTRKDPEFDLNNALAEYFNNGGDDTTEQEELLQFQSDGDYQSIGWGHD